MSSERVGGFGPKSRGAPSRSSRNSPITCTRSAHGQRAGRSAGGTSARRVMSERQNSGSIARSSASAHSSARSSGVLSNIAGQFAPRNSSKHSRSRSGYRASFAHLAPQVCATRTHVCVRWRSAPLKSGSRSVRNSAASAAFPSANITWNWVMKCGHRSSGGSFAASMAAMNCAQAACAATKSRLQVCSAAWQSATTATCVVYRLSAISRETADQAANSVKSLRDFIWSCRWYSAPNSTPRNDSRWPIAIAARSASSGDAYGNPAACRQSSAR